MNTIIHKVMFFLTGGQSGFAFPLSHQWHGINVAPPLYLIAFAGALLAIGLLGYCVWRKVKGRPSVIAFLAMLLSATAAYAASSTLANLSAGSAISSTDLFYCVQGGADFKCTGAQLQTWAGTVVQTGPGTTGGTCNPGATCTIQTQEIPVTVTSGNITTAISGGLYGELINYNSASDQTPTIPVAATAGNGTYFELCGIQHSQTVTHSGSDTIGGASTYPLPTGTEAAPSCVGLRSDGVSNWNPIPYGGSSGGSGNALFGTTTGNTSGDLVSMSNTTVGVQDSGIASSNVDTLSGTQTITGVKTFTAATTYVQASGASGTNSSIGLGGSTVTTSTEFILLTSDNDNLARITLVNSGGAGSNLINAPLSFVIQSGANMTGGLTMLANSGPVIIGQGGTSLTTNIAIDVVSPSVIEMPNITSSSPGGTISAMCWSSTAGELWTDTSGTICGVSALRYKNLIDDPITPQQALAGIAGLRTQPWRYKSGVGDGGKIIHVGLIADDMAKMDPHCADDGPDGQLENYSDRCLEAYMVGAIKALRTQVADLKAQLAARTMRSHHRQK